MLTPQQITQVRTSAGFSPNPNTSSASSVIAPKSMSDRLNSALSPTAPSTDSNSTGGGFWDAVHNNPLAKAGDWITQNVAGPLAQGEVNAVQSVVQRGKDLATNTIKKGQEDANKPWYEKALGAGEAAGNTVGTLGLSVWDLVSKPIESLIPANVKDAYSEANSNLVNELKAGLTTPITDNPTAEEGRQQVLGIMKSIKDNVSPEIAGQVGNLLSVLMLKGVPEISTESLPGVLDTIKGNLSSISEGASTAASKVKSVASTVVAPAEPVASEAAGGVSDLVQEAGQVTPQAARDLAWKDIAPPETPTTKLAYAKQGNVKEQGLMTKGTLTPSSADNKLIDSYEKLYDNGTIKENMSPQEKQIAVKQEAAKLHGQQKDFLASHDKAVSLSATDVSGKPIGILDRLDSVAQQSSMPFTKDAAAKGAYDSAIDTFKSMLKTGKSAGATKGATTLTGIDNAISNFDAIMEKFNAWGKTKTGEFTDTALARQQAIRDIHTEARNFIADNLPPNSPWRAIRTEESNLYEVSNRIAPRIASQVGSSQAGQFIKDNPIVKTAVGATGLGAGLHLVP